MAYAKYTVAGVDQQGSEATEHESIVHRSLCGVSTQADRALCT